MVVQHLVFWGCCMGRLWLCCRMGRWSFALAGSDGFRKEDTVEGFRSDRVQQEGAEAGTCIVANMTYETVHVEALTQP